MKSWNSRRGVGALAGAMDGATGLALLVAPAWTLSQLGVSAPAVAEIWVRWVGVFVAGVGASYGWGLVRGGEALRTTFELTALLRAGVGCFVLGAIVTGALEAGWWSVAATDLGLAVGQVALVARGAWGDDR